MARRCLLILVAASIQLTLAAPRSLGVDWVRGGENGKEPRWGIAGGLQFAIPPASVGPRGLMRMLYPTLPNKEEAASRPAGGLKYDLVNYIAVQPVVGGKEGYSELERSKLDGVPGKRLWVEPGELRGELSRGPDSVERLKVTIYVEAFANGAHVRVLVEQRADRPDEITLTPQAEKDTADLENCVLTATMGNFARARLLWLKDETVSSLKLYPDYKGNGFVSSMFYPAKRLTVTKDGELLVAITTNERHPEDARPFRGSDDWYYGGVPVTQFWKKPKGAWKDDLVAIVNGRYVYWGSRKPVPGGVAFENFEMRERFYPGQQFTFGITRRTPAELGLRKQLSDE